MLLNIIIGHGYHLKSQRRQKSFTVQLIAVFLPVHIPYMGAEALDFDGQLHIWRDPDKIAEVA
ncbi:hypothetical protein D3C71_2045800 [compost metagenome]